MTQSQNRRILVIDDNLAIHEDFRKILTQPKKGADLGEIEDSLFEDDGELVHVLEFELDFADQGRRGYEMVKSAIQEGRPYAMAFVDMRMPPGWDGVETIEHVWGVDPHMQIVISTAYSDHAWDQVIARVGHTDKLLILRKPFDNIEVQQLATALTQKWNLAQQSQMYLAELEARVAQRTAELEQRNVELQRSNQELDQFAHVASHDLQEPLRKIRSFGDRLHQKCGQGLDEQGKDYLARMQRAAERMQGLITDLLSLARVATHAQPVGSVDLAKVTQEVLSDLEAQIEATGGQVKIGELPIVEGDPLQMRQLLQNLIGNALKYKKADVPPVVKVYGTRICDKSITESGVEASHRGWEICVEDNGIGFEQQYVDRIFGVFQRLQGRSEYEGTGVGLAICKKIVEGHGGSITAKSAPQEGATFVVTLPKDPASAKRKSQEGHVSEQVLPVDALV